MSEIKSLADQLRSRIAVPVAEKRQPKVKTEVKAVQQQPAILKEILDYDTSGHKTMVHARFDAHTAKMLNHFKMATGVENTRLAAFAVKYLFSQHPELKTIIKQYIQNLEL